MSQPVGIVSKIKMTATAKSKLYKEQGKELLTDHFAIQKSYANNVAYYKEMDAITNRQQSENPLSVSEYMHAFYLVV